MNENCIGCHFLRMNISQDPANSNKEVNQGFRDQLRSDKLGFLNGKMELYCCRNMWSPLRNHSSTKEHLKIELRFNRKDVCFYYQYIPNMPPTGAIELQNRGYENKQLKDEIKRTRWGLWISAGGLVVGAIFEVLNYFWPSI